MKLSLKINQNGLAPATTEDLKAILTLPKNCIYEVEIKAQKRSSQQNKAIHKYCELIAYELNKEKLVIQDVIKINTDWNMIKVKELIFKPVVKSLYSKDSTTQLNINELDKVIDTITYYLGQKGIVCPDFPSIEN